MFFVIFICVISSYQCSGQLNSSNPVQASEFSYAAVRTVYETKWKWPWLGSFVTQQGRNYFCAGSLISEQHILSAAHCFHPKQSTQTRPEDVLVFLGKPDFNVRHDYEIESSVSKIIIHPSWKPSLTSFDADIAIAVLVKEISLSGSVIPVHIPNQSDQVKYIGHMVGWGRSEDSDPNNPQDHEKVAKELLLRAVTNEDCFLDFPNLVEISSRRTFCAGWRGFEANACHGDSGSGYFAELTTKWEVQGIVSSSPVDSFGKCIVNQYAIFTKVADYSNWIIATYFGTKDDANMPTQFAIVRCQFLTINGQSTCLLKNIEISEKYANISPKLLPVESTKQLSIVNSSVLAVPLGLLEAFPELQVLNITGSDLSFVSKKSIAGLTKINLSQNRLEYLNISLFWELATAH